MPGYNYTRAQQVAHGLINKYGSRCVLRRSSGDRDCIAVEMDYEPRERQSGIVAPTDRLFLISTEGLTIAPNKDLDRLVTFVQPAGDTPVEAEVLRQVRNPGKLAPGGIVVYWELHVTGALSNA